MTIKSPAFDYGKHIPETYSRFGENRRPPLEIKGVPAKARSLAIILEDPDAPKGTFTHWIAFNLDPEIKHLDETRVPGDALEGNNDWNEPRYGGPRPPDGEHHYFFRLFALDQKLDLRSGATRAEVDRALRGHVIAEAEWMGRFATPVQAARDAL